MFVEVPVSFYVVLHLSLSPWHSHTAPPALSATLQGHEPAGSAAMKRRHASEEGCRLQPQFRPCVLEAKTAGVYDPQPWISISTAIAMRVCVCVWMYFLGLWYTGVLCVISEVLNDLCSMCNWAALPEIRVGLTLKLSLVLGRLQWAGPTHQDRDLTQVRESKAALSALFKCQADVKCFYQYLWILTAYFILEWHVWTNKCQLHICQYYI